MDEKLELSEVAGVVELAEDDMEAANGGGTWTVTIGVSIAWCSPNGTICGSCNWGTLTCC